MSCWNKIGGWRRGRFQKRLELIDACITWHACAHGSRNMMYSFYESFLVLRTLPVPVIAAINGAAVGAGLGIAMACDMRIVAKDAKLALTFMKLGLSPVCNANSCV